MPKTPRPGTRPRRRLSLPQLFVVAALGGVATVFFDVADHSYLPFLVGWEGLVTANAGLGMSPAMLGASAASRVGHWLGHDRAPWLVSLVPAPASLLVPLVDTGPSLWISGAGWLVRLRLRRAFPGK